MKRIIAMLLVVASLLSIGGVQAEAAGISAPKAKVTTTKAGNPKITWDKVDNAVGYRVYRKTENDKKYVTVATTTKLECTDKKWSADEGSTVKYAVSAYYKDAAGKKVWSKKSTAKKWVVPDSKDVSKAIKPTATPTPKPTPTPVPTKTADKSMSQIVYISATGACYHCKATCGNMKKSTAVTLEEALDLGLRPCKNCYK